MSGLANPSEIDRVFALIGLIADPAAAKGRLESLVAAASDADAKAKAAIKATAELEAVRASQQQTLDRERAAHDKYLSDFKAAFDHNCSLREAALNDKIALSEVQANNKLAQADGILNEAGSMRAQLQNDFDHAAR